MPAVRPHARVISMCRCGCLTSPQRPSSVGYQLTSSIPLVVWTIDDDSLLANSLYRSADAGATAAWPLLPPPQANNTAPPQSNAHPSIRHTHLMMPPNRRSPQYSCGQSEGPLFPIAWCVTPTPQWLMNTQANIPMTTYADLSIHHTPWRQSPSVPAAHGVLSHCYALFRCHIVDLPGTWRQRLDDRLRIFDSPRKRVGW
jgi:hypothetical protein